MPDRRRVLHKYRSFRIGMLRRGKFCPSVILVTSLIVSILMYVHLRTDTDQKTTPPRLQRFSQPTKEASSDRKYGQPLRESPLCLDAVLGKYRHPNDVGGIGSGSLPVAYVITPTYARLTQKADLLRLCYTLMHVQCVHWIVVEDSMNRTRLVTDLLRDCPGPTITHLTALSKPHVTHRGTQQRNRALTWLRNNILPDQHLGGVYFADDDNTYDIRVFEAVRWTRTVSVWIVSFSGGALYEGPVCSKGKVTSWVGQRKKRTFPLDMAAFSVGLQLLAETSNALFNDNWSIGFLETNFLSTLRVSRDQFTTEPDSNCSKVLAWHTKTEKPIIVKPKIRRIVNRRRTTSSSQSSDDDYD